ncbi:MAG: ribosome small subunit-dependent GTPase A [Treponema sp.]|nr:ribosome small subunit-dependent GTPase A [Treponema sp.]
MDDDNSNNENRIGTVISGSNNVFDVELDFCSDDDTSEISQKTKLIQCTLKSKRLKVETRFYNPLAPGDKVQLELDSMAEDRGQISALVPRRNGFFRWNVKGRAPQLLAANIDNIILVTTPDEPPFRARFIDRELAQAEYEGLNPIILVNKYDLPAAQDIDFQERLSIWEELGYRVLRISAKSGEGLTELAEILTGKLSAFVGQSGVGKSSLVNVLDNSCVLKTGSLSKKYGKGSHTTTKGTLMHIHLNESIVGGMKNSYASIIDTPGVRRFVLDGIPHEDLALYFREMRPLVGKCKFGMSCSHENEAGCKILEAVHAGNICEERYESWRRIVEEIKTGRWED